uniref:MarC family NAAT transporter n=1 Tax=Flavobacterium sp. TaxID=239 RepID=UPI00404A13E7
MELFIYVFAALFSVLNPLGAVPIFVGLTQDDSKQERSRISLWTAINVAIILIISYFIGQFVLKFFGISIDALRIAGGLLIVNSGFSLLSGNVNKRKGLNKRVTNDAMDRNDIALTPLAMPMLAGPGSMSLLIAMYQEQPEIYQKIITCVAILSVALTIFLVLRSAHYLSRILGASGIVAISRIIGFIVVAIGIQYISSSLVNIFQTI